MLLCIPLLHSLNLESMINVHKILLANEVTDITDQDRHRIFRVTVYYNDACKTLLKLLLSLLARISWALVANSDWNSEKTPIPSEFPMFFEKTPIPSEFPMFFIGTSFRSEKYGLSVST